MPDHCACTGTRAHPKGPCENTDSRKMGIDKGGHPIFLCAECSGNEGRTNGEGDRLKGYCGGDWKPDKTDVKK
ncbi:hypothetical protein PG999_000075 [Apiospora kogelbergensis]|uniref:Uncharacterized protein n=1 Tax=Apiospora kogelbergensis TaxID=1337665 RepID=A0AAW0RAQ6_9PEZI